MKKALIFGVTGQDGSYLAELLMNKGYEVHGIIRRASTFNTGRIEHLSSFIPQEEGQKFTLHFGDLADASTVRQLIYKVQPDEIYNLGAQSHVRVSFDIPEYTGNITGLGVLRILEAIKDYQEHMGKTVKFYQASSSEMFGAAKPPQNEATPFYPRSPYGVAKVYAYWIARNYREAYGIFAANGILFNHESERRGETFVTRKITRAVNRIKAGLQDKLYLGNLDARRDWGYAKEYVEAMWLMLQQPEADDYVIGTGESHSVKDFVIAAFKHVGIDDWEKYIGIDPRYYRPTEVESLIADASKAKQKLNWSPKVGFDELVKIMMDADAKDVESEKAEADRKKA
jgi:GDPmannose 4,6-dehydratase